MAYDYDKMKSAYQQLTKQQQQDWVNQNKDNANVQRFAKEYAAEIGWTKTSTPSTTSTTSTASKTTPTTTYTSKPEYQGQWWITTKNDPSSSPYVNQWQWQYTYNPTSWYYEVKWQTTQTQWWDKIRQYWDSLSYEEQQQKLKENPNLRASLAKYWATEKQQEVKPETKPEWWETPSEWWDYQSDSPERMAEIAANLEWYKQTMPYLFNDKRAFDDFFINWKGRSQAQIDFLNQWFENNKKYGKYDALTPDSIWYWIAYGDIPEDYLTMLKTTDPAKYQAALQAKQDAEDKIKDKTSLDTTSILSWESEDTITSKAIEWLKSQWLFLDNDGNLIDDRTENYATDEEKQYAKDAADIIARNLDIDNTVKHTYEDLVKKYPWATKATLMAMAQDTNADLLREKENNNVELTRLQWYMNYMQTERQERNRVWENAINQLQKQYGMYYQYTPQWMSELAQAQYAATNVTLDQADYGTDTQKQMALDRVLTSIYQQYGDIIQRPMAQVINDVMALAKNKGISLSQALEENFMSFLRQKPEYQQMQSMLSEPNLQIIWYNSDWKAVYWYWDSATKTFKQVSVWAGGISTWWTTWDGTSYITNIQPLNNFISDLETKYDIASEWWTWWWKIRGWWCWTVVNDYLGSVWDNIKLSEANDIKPYATSKVPAEWAVAYFDWTQSRATPETKKHGHVWIVVSDNGDTITVLESNEGTWLRYKDYKKSSVTGYYVPEWIKTNEYKQSEYGDAFIDAANIIKPKMPSNEARSDFMDTVQKYLDVWKYTTAYEYIMSNARNVASDSATREKLNAAETAMIDLVAIKDALEAYYAAWWETWILQWNLEDVANALGNTTDRRLVWLTTKIAEAIQAYRKNISWTAFSEKEAEDYEKLFPTIKAWQEYNTAKLEEVLQSMITRANWLYGNLIWPNVYKNLLTAHESATWRKYSAFEEQSDLYQYLKDNWYLSTDWNVKEPQDFVSYMQNIRKGKRF